jgi:hypothetical protein
MWQKDKICLFAYPAGRTDKTFKLPDNVITINSCAFCGADYLEELNLSNTLYRNEPFIIGCYNTAAKLDTRILLK